MKNELDIQRRVIDAIAEHHVRDILSCYKPKNGDSKFLKMNVLNSYISKLPITVYSETGIYLTLLPLDYHRRKK